VDTRSIVRLIRMLLHLDMRTASSFLEIVHSSERVNGIPEADMSARGGDAKSPVRHVLQTKRHENSDVGYICTSLPSKLGPLILLNLPGDACLIHVMFFILPEAKM